jgi:uncharacterized protein YabE (DUF348 family)
MWSSLNGHKRVLYLASGLLIVCGALLVAGAWLYRPVRVIVDGNVRILKHPAWTVKAALTSSGVQPDPHDRVEPPLGAWLPLGGDVQVDLAATVSFWDGSRLRSLSSPERIPANLLAALGLKIYPGDRLLAAGAAIDPTRPLAAEQTGLLQFAPARAVTLSDGASQRVIYASAATLGEALWQAGIRPGPYDRLDPPASTALDRPVSAHLQRARELAVDLADKTVTIRSAADTVGGALADAGIALQGLDYAVPAEDQPVPANGEIRVVRVREEVSLEQTNTPFKNVYQPDPNTELDQHSIIQAGVVGIQVKRTRILYEDGVEKQRTPAGEWTASLPRDQIVGIGTQVVLHTDVVDGATITYWRKITAYATSYSPCEGGTKTCSYTTASGATLTKGIVAMVRSWYNALRGSQVYIPGYGQATVADIGGGVGGANWIDLGFDDSNYVEWHSNVTVYFLAPAPAVIPGLP